MEALEIREVIDGHLMYGLLAGKGESTVVLDAGLGDTSETWEMIQPEVAKFSRVFSYDRAGLGKSEKAPTPRTCEDMVTDLRNLLSAPNLHPPYVLVTHSWSGINARWYASQYPNEIAGMVLIDTVHEDKFWHFEKFLPEDRIVRMWNAVRDPAKNDETIDRIASIEQLKSVQRYFDFPLIVLTRAISPNNPDDLIKIEINLQAEFLKLSPKSQQFFSKYEDHFIQKSEPELVVKAIYQVVEAIKS
jgi:pimeloyl-ACP methyl ester carboxylesterase